MRKLLVLVLILLAITAHAADFGRTYLVPAYSACPGDDACPAVRESSYTFSSALVRTSPARYIKEGAVSFILELRGVRDASGATVTSSAFRVKSAGGQTTSSGLTLPPALVDQFAPAPQPIELKNGNGKLTSRLETVIPPGTVSEGGAIIVLDPDGKRLAITGAQSRP